MANIADQTYLLSHQYQNASNLNARVALHARFSTNPYGWHQWVFDQLRFPETCRLLELGCGPGWLWRENQDRIPDGWDIVLSDFSAGMLAEARHSLANSSHPFTFENSDAQAIPFADASFDGVIANHMLYHVPDIPRALDEVRRVLKPDGRFYAATNGDRHLQEIAALARRFALEEYVPKSAAGGRAEEAAWHNRFGLENGAALLSMRFTNLTLHRYENSLRVTEAAPLVAYLRSTLTYPDQCAEKLQQLQMFVEAELAQHSVFYITKETGLFIASR
jgi:ubiquinone/menaquinone biosynthesis C-methylase UbiE